MYLLQIYRDTRIYLRLYAFAKNNLLSKHAIATRPSWFYREDLVVYFILLAYRILAALEDVISLVRF